MIKDLAARLGVEERALRAILRVECGSDDPTRWLRSDGRPIIRVEAHLALKYDRLREGGLRVLGPERWQGHEVELDGAWLPYHGEATRPSPDREYDALDVATSVVGLEAAVASTSWGCAQILGTWRELGLDRADQVPELAGDASGCLELLERYLVHVDHAALGALRVRDWRGFARAYNGSGQVDWYAGRMSTAYAALG